MQVNIHYLINIDVNDQLDLTSVVIYLGNTLQSLCRSMKTL